ncbi:MAG: signal peptide peptidase SppA [Planctomycetaceae bacterium]|nr:signal peptide peptidase SppA [Planctomycetaceae bacterium]
MEPRNHGNPADPATHATDSRGSGNPSTPSGAPIQAEALSGNRGTASGSQVVYVPQPVSFIRSWIAWLGWVACFICLAVLISVFARFNDYFDNSGGIQERYHSHAKTGRDKIAVINVNGVIASGAGFVKRQIDRVTSDENVKAVVLRINSPGGTITGSDFIYHHLQEMKKNRDIPIVVSMGGIAASGGYYIAMTVGDDEKTIYAEPTSTTGSIGVIIPHYDVSGLLEKYDVKDDSIVSHPRKQMLSMTRPIDPEDRQVLEAYLQDAFGRFKEVVKSGRPALRENDAALNEIATGEIFTATQAQANGLVDELGFIEDAIDRAIEMAGLEDESVRVVEYKAPVTFLNAFTSVQAARRGEIPELAALMELSVPRAYYMVTSFPPLMKMNALKLAD